jgi:hypothetical protein
MSDPLAEIKDKINPFFRSPWTEYKIAMLLAGREPRTDLEHKCAAMLNNLDGEQRKG